MHGREITGHRFNLPLHLLDNAGSRIHATVEVLLIALELDVLLRHLCNHPSHFRDLLEMDNGRRVGRFASTIWVDENLGPNACSRMWLGVLLCQA